MTGATVNRDSRSTAYRGAPRRAGTERSEPTHATRSVSNETRTFRWFVRALLDAPATKRNVPFNRVVTSLRTARDPVACLNVLIEECATNSGQDGLGLGIDVLARGGSAVLEAAEVYARRKRDRQSTRGLVIVDAVWYMLLHGVARADAPPLTRFSFLTRAAALHPWPSVRASSAEALGVLAELEPRLKGAIRVHLGFLPLAHSDLASTVKAVLADLEG